MAKKTTKKSQAEKPKFKFHEENESCDGDVLGTGLVDLFRSVELKKSGIESLTAALDVLTAGLTEWTSEDTDFHISPRSKSPGSYELEGWFSLRGSRPATEEEKAKARTVCEQDDLLRAKNRAKSDLAVLKDIKNRNPELFAKVAGK